MQIDEPLLQQIASLAQLEVEEARAGALLTDLNKLVAWAGQLEEVDTTGVCPLVSPAAVRGVAQADVPQAPLAHAKALANAPSKDANYFRVPVVKE